METGNERTSHDIAAAFQHGHRDGYSVFLEAAVRSAALYNVSMVVRLIINMRVCAFMFFLHVFACA